ncbi:hypothetical protein ACFL2U_01025 [Patescibacteria group bacterium]
MELVTFFKEVHSKLNPETTIVKVTFAKDDVKVKVLWGVFIKVDQGLIYLGLADKKNQSYFIEEIGEIDVVAKLYLTMLMGALKVITGISNMNPFALAGILNQYQQAPVRID